MQSTPKKVDNARIFAICGREGSGKSTAAELFIAGAQPKQKMIRVFEPEQYIMSVLFGWDYDSLLTNGKPSTCDPIWDLTYDEAKTKILTLLRKWLDPEYTYPTCTAAPHPTFESPQTTLKNQKKQKRKMVAFADPLKKVAAVIFNIPYEILLANTPETRIKRETHQTKSYLVAGVLTGRTCLEYLGTEIMRNQFDEACWIKMFQRDVTRDLKAGYQLMLADLRFVNEYQAMKELGALIAVIYRHPKDLKLTEQDKKTHPAKWHFLRFSTMLGVVQINNSGPLGDLPRVLEASLGITFS